MDPQRHVTLWPRREQYARFADLCDDQVPGSFDEFETIATEQIADLAREGIRIETIDFDPDEMARWCRSNFGAVNGEARASYAAFISIVVTEACQMAVIAANR